jgi:glycosyltransferase involved in cell wall biosynthesis
MSRRLMTLDEVRASTAVVVPAYFSPEVRSEVVHSILEGVLEDSSVYCRPERLLVVVDRDTITESAVRSLGVPHFRLETNRGKGGAIRAGLQHLVGTSDAEYFATRDCDGDHALEDLPRLVSMAREISNLAGAGLAMVMGARPSLAKPMGWLREEWERLTNRVLQDLLAFLLAREGRVIDRRFWGGIEPDIQSGYRVYSREAADAVVQSLAGMPEDPAVWTFACEFLPFADLTLAGATFGQVQRMTLVEQPVTSYGRVDLASAYGCLLGFVADRNGVSRDTLLQLFDNHVPGTALYFSDARNQVERARKILCSEAGELVQGRFL